jgi:hypothetical protein
MRLLGKVLAIVSAAAVMVLQASALTITDVNYLGSTDPGSPASESDEAAYINYLTGMTLGDTDLDVAAADVPVDGPKTYDFRRSNNSFATLPTVTVDDADKSGDDPAPGPIDITGISYILAKYGGVAHVWYVGNLTGSQTLPADLGKGAGLSHYTTFGERVGVPDGGATAVLLGVGMLGLAALRRKS